MTNLTEDLAKLIRLTGDRDKINNGHPEKSKV